MRLTSARTLVMTAKGSNGRNIVVKVAISGIKGAVFSRFIGFILRASAIEGGLVSGDRAEVFTSPANIWTRASDSH